MVLILITKGGLPSENDETANSPASGDVVYKQHSVYRKDYGNVGQRQEASKLVLAEDIEKKKAEGYDA